MTIQNFPAALQPIIQQNFLEREFEQGLRAHLAYRAIADRIDIAARTGETITKTRAGLKSAVTSPLSPSSNTNLDNGLTTDAWAVEQFTVTLQMYGATMDLNMVTDRVGLASQFLQNARNNGEQAIRSLDTMARNALFAGYMGGNTRVRVTLGSAGPNVSVDDVRGFQTTFVNGVQTAIGGGVTMSVTVGSNVYTLTSVAVDGSNVSTAYGGISGSLTFSTNVTVNDGTAGNAVVAATAPSIIRAGGVATTAALSSSNVLTMANLLDAKAKLELNSVPKADSGFYHCYLDAVSARQLFADPDFKILFQGATSEVSAFKSGDMASPFLGLRFIQTHLAPTQTAGVALGLTVRRPIICGQGAIIEGDFAGTAAHDVAPGRFDHVDGRWHRDGDA